MFKALKEKVSNEYEKAKVNIQSQALTLVNNGSIGSLTNSSSEHRLSGDSNIHRNDSLTSIGSKAESIKSESFKYPESGFSLVDLDDDQAPQSQPSTSKLNTSSDSDSFFKKKFFSNIVSNFMPQSDLESEYESESGNLNLDNVSKEQLVQLCYKLKNKGKKHRERWTEVVRAYKQIVEEREKLQNFLSETQDTAKRRLNELKEQCQLEQEAKRHLEENLQVTIEEKEEQIKVLQTKIQLINSSEKGTRDLIDVSSDEKLVDKVERLESLLTKCNESLKSNKEQLAILIKENEQLLHYKDKCLKFESEIENIRKLKDSASVSFAEAKQKLYDELESHKIIIKELKDQNEKKNYEIKQKNNEIKSNSTIIKSLNDKVAKIESSFEAEKSNLLQELSFEKSAAINSLKEDYELKIKSNIEKYEIQLANLKQENSKLKESMIKVDDEPEKHEELRAQLEESNAKLNDSLTILEKLYLEMEIERKSHSESLSKSISQSEELQNEIQMLNKKLNKVAAFEEKYKSVNSSLEKEKSKHKTFLKETESLKEKVKVKNDKINNLSSEVENLKHRLQDELAKHKQDVQSETINKSVEQFQNKIESLIETNECNVKKLLALEKDVEDKSKELKVLTSEREKLYSEMDYLKQNSVSNQIELENVKKENESLQKALDISKNLLNSLRESVKSLQNNNANAIGKEELTQLKEKVINFKNSIVDLFGGSVDSKVSDDYDFILSDISVKWKKLVESCQTSDDSKCNFYKFAEEIVCQMEDSCDEVAKLQRLQLTLENDVDKKETELRSLMSERENLTKQLKLTQQEVEHFKKDLNLMTNELDSKDAQLAQTQKDLADLQKEFTDMREQLQSSDESVTQYNKIVDELKELQLEKQKLAEQFELLNKEHQQLNSNFGECSKQNSVYLDEITKIKSNAKEILESKHKLNEKLKQSESSYQNLKKDHQKALNRNNKQEQEIKELIAKFDMAASQREEIEKNVEKLNLLLNEKDVKLDQKDNQLKELEDRISSLNSVNQSHEVQINRIKDEFRISNEKCIEFEERLKLKDTGEQDLRTEVIALEEKLKRNVRGEKELKEELRLNEEVNSSLKEQVHKYLAEIKQLKIEIEALQVKHEDSIDKLYKQLEVRESQLDESLMNSNSQYNSAVQDLLKSKSEVTKLTKQIEDLVASNNELTDTLNNMRKTSEDNMNRTCLEYESQIKRLQTKLEQQKQQIAEKTNQFDNMENKIIADNKSRICELEDEVNEKDAALSEIHEYYKQKLKSKDNEVKNLHEQLSKPDKNNYQINALQNSILQYHEENSRLREIIQMRQDKANENSNSDMENCALLGVHLPQPTEYEYLRNILYEFMMGREPVTLSKVIAAVMRFNGEQTDQIIRKQEALHMNKHGKPN